MEEIIFSAGCFWSVQNKFDKIKGIISTEVGYCGGTKKNPSYEEVCSGKTGHTESIKVIYDPRIISFPELCIFFFKIHNFSIKYDTQYKSIIFYNNNHQKEIAIRIKKKILKKYKCFTEIKRYRNDFFKAEEYHQKYLQKIYKKRLH